MKAKSKKSATTVVVPEPSTSEEEPESEMEDGELEEKEGEELNFPSFEEHQAAEQEELLQSLKAEWETNRESAINKYIESEIQKRIPKPTEESASMDLQTEMRRRERVDLIRGTSVTSEEDLKTFAEGWTRKLQQHPNIIKVSDLIDRIKPTLWFAIKVAIEGIADETDPSEFLQAITKRFAGIGKTPKSTVTVSQWTQGIVNSVAAKLEQPSKLATAVFAMTRQIFDESMVTYLEEFKPLFDNKQSNMISLHLAKSMRKNRAGMLKVLVTRMEKKFRKDSPNLDDRKGGTIDDLTLEEFLKLMLSTAEEIKVMVEVSDQLTTCARYAKRNPGAPTNEPSNPKTNPKKGLNGNGDKRPLTPNPQEGSEAGNKRPRTQPRPTCKVCGRFHGGAPSACKNKDHPNANHTKLPWAESVNGKAMKEAGEEVLPWNKKLTASGKLTTYEKTGKDNISEPAEIRVMSITGTEEEGNSGQSTQRKDTDHVPTEEKNADILTLDQTDLIDPNDGAVWAELLLPTTIAQQLGVPSPQTVSHPVRTLIDTGSNIFSFANHRIKALWTQSGGDIYLCNKTVRVGPNRVKINEYIVVPLRMASVRLHKENTFKIKLYILPLQHDIVLGKVDIKKRPELKSILFHDIMSTEDLDWIGESIQQWKEEQQKTNRVSNSEKGADTANTILPLDKVKVGNVQPSVHALKGETPMEKELPSELGTDPELQQAQRVLLEEFQDCFSSKLRPEAARVPPMDLKVADSWDRRENRQPARYQTTEKQQFINEHTKELRTMGVTRESQASAHSQVHLTRKADNTWRFCCDFRRLNAATQAKTWPLPNIEQMLQRIGAKKPKYLATIDLRHGYWQLPLSESSRHYTAFITATALFEWCRVPMGLQGASAYFQRTMQTIVLPGLLHNTCEVYLDDVIVWGTSREEYLNNLRKVLERLRKYGITAGPKKCRLGQQQLEYVGHVIDERGVEFKRERLQAIIDFNRPTKLGELKTFLGLATYVRQNTSQHFAEVAAPLHQLLKQYTKKKRNQPVSWTEETVARFDKLKELVNNSQKLFFYNTEASEIRLYTDASQYGIGAVLVQVVDGIEQTVAFMSRTLNKTQLNYSTVEREALAIAEAFKKFEYLLRSVHFKLYTDHKNLCHIRDSGSPRVIAYKMLIQEYDFAIAHVAGERNVGADFMSRNRAATELETEPEAPVITDLDAILPLRGNAYMCAISRELIIPTQEQYSAMKACHNATVGHNGVEPTIQRLEAAGKKWKHRRQMVQDFIKQCDVCQKNARAAEETIHVKPYTLSGWRLMEDRSIDFVGPFTEDAEGYKYICVIIDTFSRWVELYRCKEPTAEEATAALLAHFGRFGIPKSIRSDRGSAFTSTLCRQFLEKVGVEHKISIADSHQENGIVEAANAEVRRYLNDICYDKQLHPSNWSASLPFAQRIQNSLTKAMTGVAPAYLLYAGGLDLNKDIIPDTATEIADSELQPWIAARKEAQRTAIKAAQDKIAKHAVERQSKDPGERTEFPIGSLVLRTWAPSQFGAKPHKQNMKLTGPFEVVGFDEQTYILKDPATGKELPPLNVHRLRPYYHDPSRTDPAQIRSKDINRYMVDKIISFKGSIKRKRSLRFLVKWAGHEELTEEPWENVRECEPLHQFLKDNKLAQHIPGKFR